MNKELDTVLIIEAARQNGFLINQSTAEYIWRKFSQSRGSEWIICELWSSEEIFAAIKDYIQ